MPVNRWRADEIETLKRMKKEGYSLTRTAKALGRAKASVSRKASSLELGRWELEDSMKAAMAVRREQNAIKRMERQERNGVLADQVQDILAQVIDSVYDDDFTFYLREKGGGERPVKQAESQIPVDVLATLVRMVNETVMTQAKVEGMRFTDEQTSDRVTSVLGALSDQLAKVQPNPEILEKNAELEREAEKKKAEEG